jgi:hypothetical protein
MSIISTVTFIALLRNQARAFLAVVVIEAPGVSQGLHLVERLFVRLVAEDYIRGDEAAREIALEAGRRGSNPAG